MNSLQRDEGKGLDRDIGIYIQTNSQILCTGKQHRTHRWNKAVGPGTIILWRGKGYK